MTCQWPLWPRRPRAIATCCPTASTQTRTLNAHIVTRLAIITKAALNSNRRKKSSRKMARNHSVQLTHHVTLVGKTRIQLKDVGKALALICVPREHRQNRKTQVPQTLKENLKQQGTLRLLIQVNPIPKRLIQNTNFATTPNT